MKRVVITGIGTINSLGENLNDTWSKMTNNQSGISKINIEKNKDVSVAGKISSNHITKRLSKKELIRTDRVTQLALIASDEALKDSKLIKEKDENIGVIVGNGFGGINSIINGTIDYNNNAPISPFIITNSLSNLIASNIAMKLKTNGTAMTVNTACASGTDAIGIAFNKIKNNEEKICVAGGSEAPLNDLIIEGFDKLGALSHNSNPQIASKPFDVSRDGFVISEGAGFLVLEDLDHAKLRNAKIYAELKSYESNNDSYNLLSPDPSGNQVKILINKLLKYAKLSSNQINYVNSHGTSTYKNDQIEGNVLKSVFKHNKDLIVSSTKSFLGHSLGASGAIEAVITAKSIYSSRIHGVKNLVNPELNEINFLPNENKKLEINNAITESFGFGGHNSALLISKYK